MATFKGRFQGDFFRVAIYKGNFLPQGGAATPNTLFSRHGILKGQFFPRGTFKVAVFKAWLPSCRVQFL